MTEHSKMTLGWFWENSSTGPLLRHGGGDDGFRSEMAVYEKKDVAFGFMMNRSDGPVAEIREALRKAAVAAPLPETPRTVALIALALYEVGGTAPVISLFGEKQASSRQDAYSIYTFSVDLLRRGKLDDALDLAKGMVSHSDHPLLQHHLAETLWANGQLEGALKAVKRTLELQDGYGPSLKLLGEIERNQQKTQ